ncbi:Rid family detoxifying hydrolase [Brackiella oedipodis]|uniref:Rid family detoxifying hydrolase n=1 Tax=Brackiella oedipodis TaxID=124225 RepID=UPI000490B8BA|nr:Rid family detoxifying hydrolase [Brackiella oedipodis]
MSKQIVQTDQAPAALGPYSQAVKIQSSSILYVSGQLGLDPKTAELVSDDFEAQVRQAFSNLINVIQAGGGSVNNIIKLGLFVTDLSHFATVNQVMLEVINEPFPARSTVEVSALPKGGLFEVEAVVAL